MGLGLYCELSEIMHSSEENVQHIETIYDKSLEAVQTFYDNYHALPYCRKGHFCLRQGKCKEAIKCYAKATQVVSK